MRCYAHEFFGRKTRTSAVLLYACAILCKTFRSLHEIKKKKKNKMENHLLDFPK